MLYLLKPLLIFIVLICVVSIIKMVDSISPSPAQEEKRGVRKVRRSGREKDTHEGSRCELEMGEIDG